MRAGARLDIRAKLSPASDTAAAKLAAQLRVALERRLYTALHLQRAREACGVERRLGDAHADVRARDEGGVAQQRDASGGDARRLDVVDGLEEGLRALDERREPRREQGARRLLQL